VRIAAGVGIGAIPVVNENLHWNIWFVIPISGVILCSRIAELANGGEILASSCVKAIARDKLKLEFDDDRRVALKGFRGTHGVSRMRWDRAYLTHPVEARHGLGSRGETELDRPPVHAGETGVAMAGTPL
jgi:hypothetical protein